MPTLDDDAEPPDDDDGGPIGELTLGVRLCADPPAELEWRVDLSAFGGYGAEGDMTSEKPIGLPRPVLAPRLGLLPELTLLPLLLLPDLDEPECVELPWLLAGAATAGRCGTA